MLTGQHRRWVLVTGASGGIGTAIVGAMRGAGFRIIAAARGTPEQADRADADLCWRRLDLTSEESVRTAAADALTLAGDGLFALVHNAGIALPGAFELSTMSEMRQQVETNVMGPLQLTHALLPALRASRGRIVAVTSVVGRLPMPFNAVHCGTKHFLEGVFGALRVEVQGAGIHTAIVEPGTIRTEMIDRFAAAAERALGRVPPELDALYGRPVRAMTARMQRHIEQGSPPEVVADAVRRALTSTKPRTRYTVGRHAVRMAALAKLLPDRARQQLVSRMLDLDPAAT